MSVATCITTCIRKQRASHQPQGDTHCYKQFWTSQLKVTGAVKNLHTTTTHTWSHTVHFNKPWSYFHLDCSVNWNYGADVKKELRAENLRHRILRWGTTREECRIKHLVSRSGSHQTSFSIFPQPTTWDPPILRGFHTHGLQNRADQEGWTEEELFVYIPGLFVWHKSEERIEDDTIRPKRVLA